MRAPAFALAVAVAGLAAAAPAAAEVEQAGERGFVVRLAATVPASADAVWQALVRPKDWWDGEHSFSGDAANLSLDARPGGCFCETLPADDGKPAKGQARPAPRGGVEHMRVVYVERPRALRMIGALGPLQSEALTGTFTVQLKPAPEGAEGTVILWEYVVGGFMRQPPQTIAPAVDRMLGAQLSRLADRLGGRPAAAKPADAAPAPSPAPAPAPAPPSEGKIGGDFLDDKPVPAPATAVPTADAPVAGPPDDDRRPVGR